MTKMTPNSLMSGAPYGGSIGTPPPTGLMNIAAPAPILAETPTAAMPTPANAAGYTAAPAVAADWQVKPNQTVQSQVKDIIAENSPLMQQAETRALQKANSRGLMNSSIAVGAGQAAVFDAAAPIATADAATYARAGEFNAGAQQQVGMANAASTNAASAQNSQLQTNVNLNNSAASNDMAKFRESLDADIGKFNASESNALAKLGMDSQTKFQLANVEASYKTLMQTSQGASEMYKQYMLNVSAIMLNKDMNAEAKAMATRNQISGLNNGLGLLGKISNLNMGDLLNFDSPGAAPGTAPSGSDAKPTVTDPAQPLGSVQNPFTSTPTPSSILNYFSGDVGLL